MTLVQPREIPDENELAARQEVTALIAGAAPAADLEKSDAYTVGTMAQAHIDLKDDGSLTVTGHTWRELAGKLTVKLTELLRLTPS